MKKYSKVIISVILVVVLIYIFTPNLFAVDTGDVVNGAGKFIDEGKNQGTPINNVALQDGSKMLYNILLTVGIAVALIWGLVLGIQFITGSLEEKAEVKKGVIIYIIGCVVIFGAFGIWQIVVNALSNLA